MVPLPPAQQFIECRWSVTTADQALPACLMPTSRDVHIWSVNLDGPPVLYTQLHPYLSADEQARAARFHFDHHRHHFVIARGVLRVLLGQYLHQAPADLTFAYSDRGKPRLAKPLLDASSDKGMDRPRNQPQPTLEFNLSHSGGLALYVISCDRPVGIDVEHLRPMPQATQLAERFFSHQEYTQLMQRPPEQRERIFFRGWTRKEAYLKATGEGLAGLETTGVSMVSDCFAGLYHQPQSQQSQNRATQTSTTAQWWMQDITLDSHHLATVVVAVDEMDITNHPPCSLHYFHLIPSCD